MPAKNPYFATLKSTNYLVNALCLMDAEAEGFDQGIFLDSDGFIAEGPNMNVAIITQDGTFVVSLCTQTTHKPHGHHVPM